jgi:hypothetical protein
MGIVALIGRDSGKTGAMVTDEEDHICVPL